MPAPQEWRCSSKQVESLPPGADVWRGRQEGAGKPPSTRASRVGEVLEESDQGDVRKSERLALGQGMESDNLGP